jgi:hypothetical protein
MNRRVWTGVIAGVLAAAVLLTVGIGSYRAGQDDEIVTRTVENGEVVRVVDHGRDFFPGFFLFPLLLILLVVLVARGGRRHWYGPGHGGGWGYGPGWHRGYGPGPWGPGDGPDERMREWHRRMHEGDPGAGPAATGSDDPSPGASGPDPSGDPYGYGSTGETGEPGSGTGYGYGSGTTPTAT